jgi:hypothetical protein
MCHMPRCRSRLACLFEGGVATSHEFGGALGAIRDLKGRIRRSGRRSSVRPSTAETAEPLCPHGTESPYATVPAMQ